jgi:hypothetical protein
MEKYKRQQEIRLISGLIYPVFVITAICAGRRLP